MVFHRRVPLALLLLPIAAELRAQFPSHTAMLNPSVGLQDVHVVRSGDVVHAFGVTTQPSPGFVHYSRSSDGGRTYPVRERPLAFLGTALGFGGLIGRPAVHGEHVYVAINTAWGGPHVVASHDAGVTWSAPVRVSQRSNSLAVMRPFVHAIGQDVVVVWQESTSSGNQWSNRSADGGLTWQPVDARLDAGVPLAGDNLPRCVAAGQQVHVFWNRMTSPVRALHQVSTDLGSTWLPAPAPLGAAQLAFAAGSAAVLALADDLSSGVQISTDGGANWSGVSLPGIGVVKSLAVHGATILVVGSPAQMLPSTVELQVSTDAGATWLPVPYAIGYHRGAIMTAHATADALLVHFQFDGNAYPLGAVIQSDDFGASWRLVSDEVGRGIVAQDDGVVALTRLTAGTNDVYAWVLEGHTHHGAGTPGTGGHEPRLAGRGLAGRGRTFSLAVDQARGGSLGAVFGTFGALGGVSIGGVTSYLPQPLLVGTFVTSGLPGAPAAGSALQGLAIPDSAQFVGHRLLSQAFVIDPAGPSGFVATGALESWIR